MDVYPKEVTVGETTYKIIFRRHMRAFLSHGVFDAHRKTIELGLHCNFRKKGEATGRAYRKEEIDDTFWHEVTHAILFDMGHPLWDNESFVDGFAQRLSKMINTAKF